MNPLKKLIGETAIYGMSHILPRIFHFLVMTVYLTHRFNDDTADFGIYNKFYAYATIILAIMVFRMDTAYFRYASRTDDKEKVFFNTSLVLMFIVGAIVLCMMLFSDQLASLFNYDKAYYIRWMAWILGLDAATSIVFARFRLSNRPIRFLFYRVANVVLTVLFVMFFLEVLPRLSPQYLTNIMYKYGLVRELDFVFISNLLASALLIILMLPEILKIRIELDKPLIKTMLKYSWPLVIVALAGSLNQNIGIIVQEYWLPGTNEQNLAQMGIFSAGAKLAILLNLFTAAFNYASEPFFFNNVDKKDAHQVYGQVAMVYTLFACLMALGTYLFVDLVMILIGDNYHEGIKVMPLLLVSYIFLGLYYMVSVWYKLSDQTMYGAVVSCFGVVITCVVSYFLLPKIGIMGSAWASLLCFVGMVWLSVVLGKKHYPIEYPWGKICKYIFITAATLGISYFIRSNGQFQLNTVTLLSINTILFIVGVAILVIGEKKLLYGLIKRNQG